MKKKRVFSAEEKMQILREGEEFGTTETCRKYDLANSLFYRWKSQFNSRGIPPSNHTTKRALIAKFRDKSNSQQDHEQCE